MFGLLPVTKTPTKPNFSKFTGQISPHLESLMRIPDEFLFPTPKHVFIGVQIPRHMSGSIPIQAFRLAEQPAEQN